MDVFIIIIDKGQNIFKIYVYLCESQIKRERERERERERQTDSHREN